MESTKEQSMFPTTFKLISYYEKEWSHSKQILLNLKEDCKKNDITLDEKFNKLSAINQNFQEQNRDEDYDYHYLRNNCINLKDAIKSYFNGKEETFYTQILPFIIDQALLIEERAKNKYDGQTVPLMPAVKAIKIRIP